MASRCIQQRARRIRINKSTILNITSQNLRSLSTTNNKKREELFHKFSKQQHDVGLLQETHNHKTTGHEDIVNRDNELLLSHSAAKKSGGVGFILNRRARDAWSAAGEVVSYHEIDGVTRIGAIHLQYKTGRITTRFYIINIYFPANPLAMTTTNQHLKTSKNPTNYSTKWSPSLRK